MLDYEQADTQSGNRPIL